MTSTHSRHRNDRSTGPEAVDRLEDHPQTLCNGRKRLIGFVDGYTTYYDVRHHRIDVRLERFDGTYRMTGYYELQQNESVVDYIQIAKQHGANCEELTQWIDHQLRSDHSFSHGQLQLLLNRIKRIVHAIR